jgi:two-component system response regulator FixJ
MRSAVAIIDDDEGACHSLKWLVQSAGYAVACFHSAAAFLDLATADNRPACIIMDIHMPGINGVELYRMLKERYPGIPVVFVTGYPDQALATKARSLEPDGFFAKPLDTEALLRQIKQLIAGP